MRLKSEFIAYGLYTAFKFRYAVPENVIFTEHLALKRVGSFCHVLAFLPKNFLATFVSGTYTVYVVLSNSMYCVGTLLQPSQFPRM